jgi:glycosyltransferase involved in cell wall biosynthesis
LESIACGTPVFTFSSGGSGEMIKEGKNGFAVPSGDLLGMESLITRYFAGPQISETDCLATSLSFSKHSFAQKYLNLFSEKVLSCF